MTALRTWLRAAWDRLLGFTAIALGGVLVIAGYVGVSGTRRIPAEASYLASGSVAGLFLLICGATLVLSADLRDQWRKLRRLESLMPADELVLPSEPTVTASAQREPAEGELLPGPDVLDSITRPSCMRTRT